MLLRLNDQDRAPLYQQIAAAVRRAVADGELSPGDRLPPARELASSLGVNMHTVLRGYAELEREGLVRMRRSRGVTVSKTSAGRARLHDLARRLFDEARRLGMDPDEVVAMVSDLRSKEVGLQ
jgi:DNA-binding transcriptional regulator YhcF (GntR family)